MYVVIRVLGGPRTQSFIDGPWIRLLEISNRCYLPGIVWNLRGERRSWRKAPDGRVLRRPGED